MMKLRALILVSVLATAVGGIGLGFAQNETTPATPALASKNAPPNKDEMRKIPDQVKVTNARDMVKDMQKNLKKVQALYKNAEQKERDIQKINCINQKLLVIKGYVKVSEGHYVELRAAAKNKDGNATVHHYSMIVSSNDDVSRLTDEAGLCVGKIAEIDTKGESKVTPPPLPPVTPITPDGRFIDFTPPVGTRLPELTPFQ